jgi:uncharacterized protein (DUF849 family)
MVLLSDKFEGKNFTNTYCYDIIKEIEIDKPVDLLLNKDDIDNIYKLEKNDIAAMTSKLNHVMRITTKIQTDKEISNISSKATEKIFNKYKHETTFTEEMLTEFSKEIALAYTKFLFRGQRRDKFNKSSSL